MCLLIILLLRDALFSTSWERTGNWRRLLGWRAGKRGLMLLNYMVGWKWVIIKYMGEASHQ